MSIRKRIALICESSFTSSGTIIECDESYFGARRVGGVRGRGARGKIIVFGIFDRGNRQVYTRIVDNFKSETLISIIKEKVPLTSIIYTDKFRSYLPLEQHGFKYHQTVDHSMNEFVRKDVHVNNIENFWGLAKSRMMRLRGVPKSSFLLHLKECEFRFNHRSESLYLLLLDCFRRSPLKLS